MNIAVIISTYNSPAWLEKVLWSYHFQTDQGFELVIADDGSTNETRDLIADFATRSHLVVKHVWHEDKGFQKTKILNKAIMATQAEYLIFTDGDCIARADFVAVHRSHAQARYFLSGGYYKLNDAVSHAVTKADIEAGRVFSNPWLQSQGQAKTLKRLKLIQSVWLRKLLDFITPTKATWNGMNSSGWRSDIVAANGFDERMQYGGEDRELGERLLNAGLRSKQIRYQAICVHLDHARAYVKPDMLVINAQIRAETQRKRATVTPHGLAESKVESEPA